MLTWKKNGVSARFDGIRNTRTGELRPATEAEKEKLKKEFMGKEFLDLPGFVDLES
jgi:hypothetical protein